MRPNVAAYRNAESGFHHAHQQHQFSQQQIVSQHFASKQIAPPPWTSGPHGCYIGNNVRPARKASYAGPQHHNYIHTFPHPHPQMSLHHGVASVPTPSVNYTRVERTASFASTTTAENYAKLSVNSALNLQRINECSGIPLISTASSHLSPGQRHRLQLKANNAPPAPKQRPPANPPHTAYNWHLPNYGSPPMRSPQLSVTKNQNVTTNWGTSTESVARSPNSHFSSNSIRHQSGTVYSSSLHARSSAIDGTALARNAFQYSCSKENIGQSLQGTTAIGDQSIGTARELTEACLPRIIKPRKRRKKDRKSTNGIFAKAEEEPVAESELRGHQNGSANGQPLFNAYVSDSFRNDFAINFEPEPIEVSLLNLNNMLVNSSSSSAGKHNPHGVCFCPQCDPLRRIWDYPLRRSCSDSSATSASDQSSSSGSSSSSVISSSSHSSEMLEAPTRSRAEIVGVIGSNRANNESLNNAVAAASPSRSDNSLPILSKSNSDSNSDSNDSGFGDILSGINIAEDIFSSIASSTKSYSACSAMLEPTLANTLDAASLLLHPATAESLLTESINEISRKLMEACSGSSTENSLHSSNFALPGSETSERFVNNGAISCDELQFSFNQLSLANTSTSNITSSLTSDNSNTVSPHGFNENQTNFLFPPTTELLQLDLDGSNNKGFSMEERSVNSQQFHSNCFDLVWPDSNASSITNAFSMNSEEAASQSRLPSPAIGDRI